MANKITAVVLIIMLAFASVLMLVASASEDKEAAEVPAPEDRTHVKPVNKAQPKQGNLSEQQAPKEVLPP
jgi:ABC-type oligopeptide transport system substrate-binding subunit